MTHDEAIGVIDEVQRTRPGAARLARLVCLAVRVDAALLRRMRLRLAPELDVGIEADLWFSPLVETQGPTGFVIEKEVAAVLRQSLAEESGLFAQVESWMVHDRGEVPPSISLEERVTALAVSGASTGEIERALRPAVLALVDEQRGPDVARWAMRALPRFPAAVLKTEAAMMLSLGASARLGDRRILQHADVEGTLSQGAAWVLPQGRLAERTDLGVRLSEGGLEFFQPQENAVNTIKLPRTEPLWIELSWKSAGQAFARTVPVEPGRLVPLPEKRSELTLRTLAGDRYAVEVPGFAASERAMEGEGALFPATIYISATWQIDGYRDAVVERLKRQGHQPVIADAHPNFEAGEDIAHCDIYIALFGWADGYRSREGAPGGKSDLEIQYDEAGRRAKPRLIFMPAPSVSAPVESEEDAQDRARFERFRQRLAENHSVATFKTPEDLAESVALAIDNHQREALERGLVWISGIGPTIQTGWLASPELVVTCRETLPPCGDAAFRAQLMHVSQPEQTVGATPVCWDQATGLLVLRLAQAWSGGSRLAPAPADLRADTDLVVANFSSKKLRILTARREPSGEGETLLHLARSISVAEAADLIGSPALFRGQVMGSVSRSPVNTTTMDQVRFADAPQITALLEEAAASAGHPQGAEGDVPTVPLKLFVSYAHEDEAYRAALEKYLIVLKLQGVIEHWDDRKLVPGAKWDQEINESLEKAHVIVLLVSIDFLNSDYIRTKEMRRAMERLGAGDAVVVPVLVRTTPDWVRVPGLGSLQALPVRSGPTLQEVVPVKEWADPDAAWECVITGLRRVIERFRTGLQSRTSPTAPSPPSTSADGLKAFHTLLADSTVRAVVEQFSADFAAASGHIVVLSDYNDLHDALHNLHFQCYNFILEETRRSDAAEIDWESLASVEGILHETIATIAAVAARLMLPAGETAFFPELRTAGQELISAIEARDPAPLKTAARRISWVLAIQPSRINLRISDTARELPLADMETSMTKIREELTAADLASVEGQRFAEGVDALTRLRAGVKALCDEHDAWQEIDSEMRRIEAQLGIDLGDLEFSWENLRKKIATLCEPAKGGWAAVLNEEIEKLDVALGNGDRAKIMQAFRRCYSKASARFYDVNFELKHLCDELRKVGAELDRILKQP